MSGIGTVSATAVAAALVLLYCPSPILMAPTCPAAVSNLRRLRDEFKAISEIRFINFMTSRLRHIIIFQSAQISADAWVLRKKPFSEDQVCQTKRHAMELLIAELEKNVGPQAATTNVTKKCFSVASEKTFNKAYGLSREFTSEEHRVSFVVVYQTMLTSIHSVMNYRNMSFDHPEIVAAIFKICEEVGEVYSNQYVQAGEKNVTALELKSSQIAFAITQMISVYQPAFRTHYFFGIVITIVVLLMNIFVIPVFVTFFKKNRKVYEMLYLILLCAIDVIITIFIVVVNYIMILIISEDSWWNCLSLISTADTKLGFDIRVIVSMTLQACLSIEKFLQIWRIVNMKTATVCGSSMTKSIIRCIVSFCLTTSIILLLQCLCLRLYSIETKSFAEKYMINVLKDVHHSPRNPIFCDTDKLDKIHFQDYVKWFQRGLAITSSLIAMIFNIITACLLKKNNNQQKNNAAQKASSVYFLQILLCSISLSTIIIGSLIAILVNEFLNQATSVLLTVALPVVVNLTRNIIYVGTSKKLRLHIREMFFKK